MSAKTEYARIGKAIVDSQHLANQEHNAARKAHDKRVAALQAACAKLGHIPQTWVASCAICGAKTKRAKHV
jgi:hypothetical protein